MNLMKKPQTVLTLLIIVVLMFSACKTQKSLSKEVFNNDIFGILGVTCEETLSPNAIDSRVATIECKDITFTYDYGMYSNQGPLTPKEEFTRAFDTYHHVKFFENRMIDPKVYRIFLDSVQIVDVRRKKDTDQLIFSCNPCNTTAVLTFLGDTYYYPLTLSEDQLDMKGYTCSFEERGAYIYKYYQFDNELPGLYIAPKKNRYKTKNTLALNISYTTLSEDQIAKLFKRVYMIQEQ